MSVEQGTIPGKQRGTFSIPEQPWMRCMRQGCLIDPCAPRIDGEKECPVIVRNTEGGAVRPEEINIIPRLVRAAREEGKTCWIGKETNLNVLTSLPPYQQAVLPPVYERLVRNGGTLMIDIGGNIIPISGNGSAKK